MIEFINRDFNKIDKGYLSLPLRNEIRVSEVFHMHHNVTYWACNADYDYNIQYPSRWQLFCDDYLVCDVTLIGTMSMNARNPDLLTVITDGYIDKGLFDFNRRMSLKRVI